MVAAGGEAVDHLIRRDPNSINDTTASLDSNPSPSAPGGDHAIADRTSTSATGSGHPVPQSSAPRADHPKYGVLLPHTGSNHPQTRTPGTPPSTERKLPPATDCHHHTTPTQPQARPRNPPPGWLSTELRGCPSRIPGGNPPPGWLSTELRGCPSRIPGGNPPPGWLSTELRGCPSRIPGGNPPPGWLSTELGGCTVADLGAPGGGLAHGVGGGPTACGGLTHNGMGQPIKWGRQRG